MASLCASVSRRSAGLGESLYSEVYVVMHCVTLGLPLKQVAGNLWIANFTVSVTGGHVRVRHAVYFGYRSINGSAVLGFIELDQNIFYQIKKKYCRLTK